MKCQIIIHLEIEIVYGHGWKFNDEDATHIIECNVILPAVKEEEKNFGPVIEGPVTFALCLVEENGNFYAHFT